MADDLELVCSERPIAYVEEAAPHTHAALNLHEGVDLRVLEQIPGNDGTPHLVEAGCGGTFAIPGDRWLWDVNTETRQDGSEWVVERHLAPLCPRCGAVADRRSEPVDPYPFLHAGLDLNERRILSNPELLDLLADLSADRQQRALEVLLRGIRGGADTGYTSRTEGAVALTAATAKTVIGVKSHANFGLSICHVEVSYDGVTASAVPTLVEWCYCTFGANAPGTNSTSTTPAQEFGRVLTAGYTAGKTWTTEPTTITVLEGKNLTPAGGFVIYDFSLGREPDTALGEGYAVRLTAPAAVNALATVKVRRC